MGSLLTVNTHLSLSNESVHKAATHGCAVSRFGEGCHLELMCASLHFVRRIKKEKSFHLFCENNGQVMLLLLLLLLLLLFIVILCCLRYRRRCNCSRENLR